MGGAKPAGSCEASRAGATPARRGAKSATCPRPGLSPPLCIAGAVLRRSRITDLHRQRHIDDSRQAALSLALHGPGGRVMRSTKWRGGSSALTTSHPGALLHTVPAGCEASRRGAKSCGRGMSAELGPGRGVGARSRDGGSRSHGVEARSRDGGAGVVASRPEVVRGGSASSGRGAKSGRRARSRGGWLPPARPRTPSSTVCEVGKGTCGRTADGRDTGALGAVSRPSAGVLQLSSRRPRPPPAR
jgi:hypothetical protein